MNIAKRVLLFVGTNILIVATLSVVLSLLGVRPYIEANGINFTALTIFCVVWGFGGAFISLALSRIMAKWMMGVKVIDPLTRDPELGRLVRRVHELSRAAGLPAMPEVGLYDSPEVNAFATGPTKARSLVAVSSGLLHRLDTREVDGVLAHEVAHIANGDMVTMTLVQGVVNAFVMFLARVIAFAASTFVKEEAQPAVRFGVTLAAELFLGVLGMLVVAKFSRAREYRADAGGARLAGNGDMVAALRALQRTYGQADDGQQPALATLKINGKSSSWMRLFSTHPDLEDRIARLSGTRAV